MIPEIIPLNTNDDNRFSSRGAPIPDDELSVDYYVGLPPSKSVGGLNGSHKFFDKAVSPA